jgi:esterase
MLNRVFGGVVRNTVRRTYAVDLNFVKIANTNVKGPSRLPPLVIIHGLFGSGGNFTTISKQLEQDVYLLDMRNHGNSPHDQDMKFETMADDLEQFFAKNDLGMVDLLGFSLGGKISMTSAIRNPEKMEGIVRKLIVGDISPTTITNPKHWDIPEVMSALMEVDKIVPDMENRNQADDIMKKCGIANPMVRNFLLSNLIRMSNEGPNRFRWRFNLRALNEQLPLLAQFPYRPPNASNENGEITNNQFTNPTLFIKGERSNLIPEESKPIIKAFFPDSKIVEFPKSGHWVHTENPKLFLETVQNFLKD